MEWCAMNGVPFCIIYTKADKMSGLALQQNLKGIETEMLKEWDSMPTTFVSSAETGVGKEDILSFIEKLMKNF